MGIILFHRLHNPVGVGKNLADRFRLAGAELQHRAPARRHERRGFHREPAVKAEAVTAAIQRQARIVAAHFRLERLNLGARHIGRIADEQIETQTRGQAGETVAHVELNPFSHLMAGRVLPGDVQRCFGNVERVNAGLLAPQRQQDGQAAAAGAEIQDGGRRSAAGPRLVAGGVEKATGAFAEQFGFRARDQHLGVDQDLQAAEGSRAQEVLQRFALAPAPEQAAEGFHFGGGDDALEVQVELEPRDPQHMREQKFDLQARRIDALSGEEFAAALNDFHHRHALKIGLKFKVESAKFGGTPAQAGTGSLGFSSVPARPSFRGMKRTVFVGALLAGLFSALCSAQDTPADVAARQETEERIKTMNARIEDLEQGLQACKRELGKLNEELRILRDDLARANNNNKDAAFQKSLEQLADAIKEVDKKRIADDEKNLAVLKALKEGLSDRPP